FLVVFSSSSYFYGGYQGAPGYEFNCLRTKQACILYATLWVREIVTHRLVNATAGTGPSPRLRALHTIAALPYKSPQKIRIVLDKKLESWCKEVFTISVIGMTICGCTCPVRAGNNLSNN